VARRPVAADPVDPASAIIGGAAGYLTLWSVYWAFQAADRQGGMGYGDFKLFAPSAPGWAADAAADPAALRVRRAVIGIVLIVARAATATSRSVRPLLAAAGWIALMWDRRCQRLPVGERLDR